MDPQLSQLKQLRTARVARLATVDGRGHPHLVPCCFAVTQDETIVSAVDGKPKSTSKLRRLSNIKGNPTVSIVVDHYSDDWSELWWVRVDGQATILNEGADYEAALDILAAKYPQYVTARPTGAVVVIEPDIIRVWP